jgi:hypothetical protein
MDVDEDTSVGHTIGEILSYLRGALREAHGGVPSVPGTSESDRCREPNSGTGSGNNGY